MCVRVCVREHVRVNIHPALILEFANACALLEYTPMHLIKTGHLRWERRAP